MNRFADLLREINCKLALPQPEKSRILLEVASDLEDMYELYRSRGLGEEEALAKTREKFDISDEALVELTRIHESTFRKLLGRLSEQAQTRWERGLLIAALVFIGGFSGRQVFSSSFFRQASPFVWPLAAVSFAVLALAISETYRLYLKKDHDVKRLRSGLPWFLAMGVLSLATGWCGFVIELYRSTQMGIARADMLLPHLVEWGIRCSAMLIVSMLVALAAGLVWFVLADKVRRIEMAEAAWLLQ
jgi:hypothetical protein